MSEIIKQWLQEKLGIIINLSPENFCDVNRDGFLLSRILQNYDVINEDQLNLIHKSNIKAVCQANFHSHIVNWLKTINIHLSDDEVNDVVDANGLASLSLLYRVFLELHEKDCLTFIAKNRLNEKFRPSLAKFETKKVIENPCPADVESKYINQLENSHDVIHWIQDRMEMVVNKCKNAREEYLMAIRSNERKISTSFSFSPYIPLYKESDNIDNISEKSLDMSYEQLVKERKKLRKSKEFQPNLKESEKILSKIKDKYKRREENEIFMKELQKHILKHFWKQVIDEETQDFSRGIVSKMLKQSIYEKQMQRKLRDVKYQKEGILHAKQIICDKIAKEREAEFVDKLMEKNELLNKQEFQYYLEKQRALQLHRAIYREKLRLKAERTFTSCQDTVSGICNMAMRFTEYKNFFGEEPSERVLDNWRKMVILNQDLEEPESTIEDLISSEPVREEIVHRDIEKQNKLDKQDFQSYMNFEWPWLLDNISDDLIKEMQCGMNILGHIVHVLLNLKYPLPILPDPPDLPKVSVKVCINGLPELSCIPLLQKMLEHKKILVIELQDAINYCIEAYKFETKEEYSINEEEEPPIEDNKKQQKPKKGQKSQSAKIQGELESIQAEFSDKCQQTPKIFPDEKIELSLEAELGQIAFEELSAGNYLTDFLMVSMFIQYLKSHKDIQGWVLINYPTTFEEAVLFEEAISGLRIPGVPDSSKISKSLVDIVYMCEPKSEAVDKRLSKLLVDPAQKREPPPYETVLTAFINIYSDKDILSDKDSTTQDTTEYPSPILRFYSDMGCNYSVYYKTFDYFTVKHIGKLIIGDFSLPQKSSVELFGDTIRYLDADKGEDFKSITSFKAGEKKDRERIEKVPKRIMSANSKERADDAGATEADSKKSKKTETTIIVHEDKCTQIPETIIIEEDEEERPKPGECGWDYNYLQITETVGLVLAEIWENIEEIYVNDLSQVFFQKRNNLNAVMPYVNYVRSFVRTYICKSDQRQLYLTKFQQTFNQFDDDFRKDKEFKAELHCLVHEMRDRLNHLTVVKMMRAERQRQDIIKENWGPKQLIELSNYYVNAFQIELDRHIDTMALVNDYFTALITQVPTEETIIKEVLPKFSSESSEIEKELSHIFLDVENVAPNPIQSKIDVIYKKAISFVERCEMNSFTVYDKTKSLFYTENGNGKSKNKGPKPKLSAKGALLTVFEPPEKIRKNFEYIFDSWNCCLKGEIARIKIRLKLLKEDVNQNSDALVNSLKSVFHVLYGENQQQYQKLIDNENIACYILSAAVEKEIPLQEELVFSDEGFLINPENIMFPDPVEEPPQPVSGTTFTINQLSSLMETLYDLAPESYMSLNSFIYILQDIILNNDRELSPKEWRKLNDTYISKFVKEILGSQEYIDWKDFIIYNLTVPYPTVEQIINMRSEFIKYDSHLTERVSLEDYKNVKLWFEDEMDNNDDEIKMLLFRMYQLDPNSFNYTAMLFDFSKADSYQLGIAKALAVVSGQAVCWEKSVGDIFMKTTMDQRKTHENEVQKRDEEREQNWKFVSTIVNDLVEYTVHNCDSVVITEIVEEEVAKQSQPPITPSSTKTVKKKETSKETEEESKDLSNNTDEINHISDTELKVHQRFSNVEIGYEVKKYPSFEYFLVFDDVVTVLSRTLLWKLDGSTVGNESLLEILHRIFNELKNPNFNNAVFCHEFFNNPTFLKLLEKNNKFIIKRPYFLVEDYLIELQVLE